MTVDTIKSTLRHLFGFEDFRPGQLETIDTILHTDQDVVSIQPTSAGKTLPFQLITAIQRRQVPTAITLVVEPLIALMMDQVQIWNKLFTLSPGGEIARRTEQTKDAKDVAVMLGSMQTDPNAERNANDGMYPTVYVAPEKLPFLSPKLIARVQLLVVDECHCLTEHGMSFRPAYRNIRSFLPGVQTLALTATACPEIERDVVESLTLRRPRVIRGSTYRYNLRLIVRIKDTSKAKNIQLIKEYTASGRSVVFCPTRAECESVARALREAGRQWCRAYHAGMESDERQRVHQEYMGCITATTSRVLVATSCFGLGVNIPDIETVVHFGLPRSILAYVQECGRAGRDGRFASCVMLYRPTDISKYARTERDVDLAKKVLQLVRKVGLCRHEAMRRAFEEVDGMSDRTARCTWRSADGTTRSGAGCDVCMGSTMTASTADIAYTVADANLLLRAIRETGNYSGVHLPIDFLLGVRSARVRRFRSAKYTVYGRGRHRDRTDWVYIHGQMVEQRVLREIVTNRGFVVYKLSRP